VVLHAAPNLFSAIVPYSQSIASIGGALLTAGYRPAGEPLTVKTTANSRRVHPGVYVGVVLFSLALILLVLLIFLVRRDNRKRAEYHRRMYAPAEPVDTARWAQFREPGSQSSIVSWRREPTAGGYAPTPT